MAETFYKRKPYKPDHTKFGGVIYYSDFDTNYPSGNIAERIEKDRRFDEQCRKNLINRPN